MKINAEDDWLNAFVLDPGFVFTDMGNAAAEAFGIPSEALNSVDAVSRGIFNVFTNATKEKFGGKVVSHTGDIQGW